MKTLLNLCNIKNPTNFLFVFQVVIDRHPVRFFVHKRPHVDFFLEVVRLKET